MDSIISARPREANLADCWAGKSSHCWRWLIGCGRKAIFAAEAYVLGLFQLYPTVYFHKATRGAEKICAGLLARVIQLIQDDAVHRTGLPNNHPLVKFALNTNSLDAALGLDDTVVWGALDLMRICRKLVAIFRENFAARANGSPTRRR